MLVTYMNTFGKPFGAHVGTADVGTGDETRWTFTGSTNPSVADVEASIEDHRRLWEGPYRTAAGWRDWNVTVDRAAGDVLSAMDGGPVSKMR